MNSRRRSSRGNTTRWIVTTPTFSTCCPTWT
jgi:hypothetical protein